MTVQAKDVNPAEYIREAGIDLSLVLPAPDGIFVGGDMGHSVSDQPIFC